MERRVKEIAFLAMVTFISLVLAGCSNGEQRDRMVVRLPDEFETSPSWEPAPGSYRTAYIAHENDDLGVIARSYDVPVNELAQFNRLSSSILREGQVIYIPRKEKTPGTVQKEIQSEAFFIWPVKGTVTTGFGDDIGGAEAKYVLIEAAHGTMVKAAKSGVVSVAYQGDEEGQPGNPYYADWGNFLWISHGGGEFTIYAHLAKTFKEEGASVTQGDTIGMVGTSGEASSPVLRFMLYEDGDPVDPIPLLQ